MRATLQLQSQPRYRVSKRGQGAGIYLWRGKTYVGADAVATASGTSRRTVQYHLTRHGNLSSLGNGPGGHNKGCRGGARKQVALMGRQWPSIASFSSALGVTPKTARIWLRHGTREQIVARLMAADAGQRISA